MSILSIKGLRHSYDDKILFDGMDLQVNNGEHLGIVGLNGAGKTTFLNIVCKKTFQDEGEVIWLNNIRWGYLDQHADIEREQTVMEYLKQSFNHLYEDEKTMNELYEKMAFLEGEELEKAINKASNIQEKLLNSDFYDLEAKIKKVANGLGVNAFGYDTIIKKLSGGQRAKLMLSKLLLEDLDVMLLDEPTNFLDVAHIEWLKEFLNSFKGTFMVISHDTDFLDSVCKGIISVENGIIKKYSGNYSFYKEQHEMARKQYQEDYERQQREIKKMEDYIAKNKARAATAGMANSRKKMLDRIEVMTKPITMLPAKFNFPYTLCVTKEILNINNLKIGYNNKQLVPDINFSISSTDKIWIKGANGTGKTTFIKTIMNLIPSLGGDFSFHINSKINYIEQDLEFRKKDINAQIFMSDTYPKMSQKDIKAALAKTGIKNELMVKLICDMSGGEQVRVKLCSLCQKESNILILDEPTNHLDVIAKDALKDALKEYDGAVILVSHETMWADEICNCSYDIEEAKFENKN